MTRLEQIEFKNEEKFMAAIKAVLNGSEVFRPYEKNGETKKKLIINKNRLYTGNNFSIGINKAENGKIYISTGYFSVEDRFEIAKKNSQDPEHVDATEL